MRLNKSYLPLLLLCLCCFGQLQAKKKLPKTVIRAWTLPSPLALADTQQVDTSYYNFAMKNVVYDYSKWNHYNGNLVSPLQPVVYFDRTRKTDCMFATAYDVYTITPQDVRFYNTTTPYSTISYKKGFTTNHADNDLDFKFTGNLNARTNLGATINYLNAVGHYKNQAGKTVNGSVFGSYNGRHYSLQAAFTFNTLSNFENGGLRNAADLQNKSLNAEDIAVKMEAMSGFRYLAGYLNHYYSICVDKADTVRYTVVGKDGKEEVRSDSLRITSVPILTFRHVFETTDATRRYIEKTAKQTLYTECFINPKTTNDTIGTTTISNTLSATFEEGYNKKMRFGLTAFAINEFQRHTCSRLPDWPIDEVAPFGGNIGFSGGSVQVLDSVLNTRKWSNNTFVGGAIYKQTGRFIRYMVNGEVCVAGRKLGEFHINGKLGAGFRAGADSLMLDAAVSFRNETPDRFLQHFVSNHYCWDNDFRKPYRFRVTGGVAYPNKWIKPSLRVNYETVTRLIYFEGMSAPKQADNTISVLGGEVQADLTTPWLNLENRVAVQYSSSYLIAVPAVCLYHNLYYHGTWFRALDAQIGADVSYNTAYYAPVLNPAIGQFCAQNEVKVGNYPVISLYANFYVRLLHLRFFLHYKHLNSSFMSRTYYSMPSYPVNPGVFSAGLAFHFYK